MFSLEVHTALSSTLHEEINQLIFNVWTSESKVAKDVSMLVQPGESVHDSLNDISHHILLREQNNHVIAYGRLTLIKDQSILENKYEELQFSSQIFPIGYISRLVVHPEYRGLSLSSMIHSKRIEIAIEEGAQKIFGWAVGDLPRSAIRKAGFTETKIRLGFSTTWYKTSRTTRLVEIDLTENQFAHLPVQKQELPSVSSH